MNAFINFIIETLSDIGLSFLFHRDKETLKHDLLFWIFVILLISVILFGVYVGVKAMGN